MTLKISISPTLNCRATGGEQPERTGIFCWKGSQPQPSLPKGSRRKLGGAACQQYPATHTLLPLSSREEEFCPECPMKTIEHMNKNVGVCYPLSSTASWNGLLVKMISGMYSKAFSDVLEKNIKNNCFG